MQLKAGITLQAGKYQIVRVLGQGGFGITYEAVITPDNSRVAIKEFYMKEFCDRDANTGIITLGTTEGNRQLVSRYRAKFLREAQMIASLNHPNIVHVYDVFEENGTVYYVMDYIDGPSLDDMVRKRGPLPEQEAIQYIYQTGNALSYLHFNNSLHFDVKPANILVDSTGKAVLIDFGVSKHYDDAGRQTSSTPVGISDGYAPLEQYRHSEIEWFTPATDIYALGATLYKLLTGQTPPPASVIHEDGLPPMPKTISPSVQYTIQRAMMPKRADRPQNVGEFVNLLQSDPPSVTAGIVSESEETVLVKKESFKIPKWVYSAVAGVVVIVAAILFWPSGTKNGDGRINGHEYVDLGLSVKWATCNVGASAPEEDGDHFAWGEVKPKEHYTWENYKFRASGDNSNPSGVKLSKYVTDVSSGEVDNRSYLAIEDDAANKNWGGSWRMPSEKEIRELQEKCTWKIVNINGKDAYEITGPNGNSIILPCAGSLTDFRGSVVRAMGGAYWSSTLYKDTSYYEENSSIYAYCYNIDGMGNPTVSISQRSFGASVRPVSY